MTIKLIFIEIRLQLRSIAFYLCLILSIGFFLGQVTLDYTIPEMPLNKVQFTYLKLLEDYKDGKINLADARQPKYIIFLNEKQKDKILEVIKIMNPDWIEEFHDVTKITFSIDEEMFEQLMSKLNEDLGSNTYYQMYMVGYMYDSYCGNNFAPIIINGFDEQADLIVARLQGIKGIRKVTQYSAIGIGRTRDLTEDEIIMLQDTMTYIMKLSGSELSEDMKDEELIQTLYSLDKKIGGNTEFGDNIFNSGSWKLRHRTYEEAMDWFEEIAHGKDKITNVYARIVADYMGILAGILPAFLAAFVLLRDKKNKMQGIIYYRNFSSWRYVLSKFIALFLLMSFCFCIIASYFTYYYYRMGQLYGYDIDLFAFYKYTALFVFPTIMFVIAFCIFISMLCQNGLPALVLQMLLYFLSIITLSGDYRWFKIVIRINDALTHAQYMEYRNQIIVNRCIISLMSIIFLFLTIKILDRKRSALVH